jgi:outer membrane lipoprotein SlyB
MFRKISLATAAAAATLAMVPATAEARHRSGYYDHGRYEQTYRGDRYGRYDNRYYGRSVRYDGRRCSGTTGTVVGGVAGALLGREVTRDRYRGRSGTTGTILGGAIGALAGRAVQKSGCR